MSDKSDIIKPAVCYRLVPHGEPIHTTIDIDPAVNFPIGFPEDIFDRRELFFTEKWVEAEYIRRPYNPKMYVEAVLLMKPRNCICIDTNNFGVRSYEFNGNSCWCEYPGSEERSMYRISPANTDRYEAIGYRPSKVMQYRGFKSVYRLQYDRETNEVVTNAGRFQLGISPDVLSSPSKDYAGYKTMIDNKKFAVVYLDDEPLYLDLVDGELVPSSL